MLWPGRECVVAVRRANLRRQRSGRARRRATNPRPEERSGGARRPGRGGAAGALVSWVLVLIAPADELELLAARVFEHGALGVELQEPGQPLMPGTPELPPGAGRCVAHFAEGEVAAAAARGLERDET